LQKEIAIRRDRKASGITAISIENQWMAITPTWTEGFLGGIQREREGKEGGIREGSRRQNGGALRDRNRGRGWEEAAQIEPHGNPLEK